MKFKHIFQVIVITIFILLVPFIAMQFTDQVVWELSDFVVAGIILFVFGVSFKYFILSQKRSFYKKIIGVIVLLILILIWAELGVGVFGTPWAGS